MRLYRYVLDFLEEISTGMAALILVNSLFTQGVFKQAFPRIQTYQMFRHNRSPQVLYPAISLTQFDLLPPSIEKLLPTVKDSDIVITSLNRYERKKDLPLALKACSLVKAGPVVLVVAGGYDERVIENVEHHLELVALSQKLNLKVIFLRSISNEERISLLKRTDIMLYTP